MIKRIFFTLLGLGLIVAVIAGIKVLQIRHLMAAGANMAPPPETISTLEAKAQSWETVLSATATVDAVQGVTVAAEQPGKVVAIHFTAGAFVQKGDLLAQQDTSAEEAQLRAIASSKNLAAINLRRLAELADKDLISRTEYDTAKAGFQQAEAQTENIQAIINRKNIRAPFSGRLGIRRINIGEILKEGQEIVTLQTLDPVFVNFSLPQQELGRIAEQMEVRITSDDSGQEAMVGLISAIDPKVDAATRSIRVQATAANSKETLRPGMFVKVSVVLPEKSQMIVIPGTAVAYAPYSDTVFVVEKKHDEKSGKEITTLRQQIVRLGEQRGDFVAALSGLQAGETIASTGVFKLRNGQMVVINNSIVPTFEMQPQPENN